MASSSGVERRQGQRRQAAGEGRLVRRRQILVDAARQGHVQVGVHVGKAWHDGLARAVDFFRLRVAGQHLLAGSDRRDAVSLNRHRTVVDDRVIGINGRHGRSVNDDRHRCSLLLVLRQLRALAMIHGPRTPPTLGGSARQTSVAVDGAWPRRRSVGQQAPIGWGDWAYVENPRRKVTVVYSRNSPIDAITSSIVVVPQRALVVLESALAVAGIYYAVVEEDQQRAFSKVSSKSRAGNRGSTIRADSVAWNRIAALNFMPRQVIYVRFPRPLLCIFRKGTY